MRGGLVNEAVTSCCESFNFVYQIRMVFPLIESQSVVLLTNSQGRRSLLSQDFHLTSLLYCVFFFVEIWKMWLSGMMLSLFCLQYSGVKSWSKWRHLFFWLCRLFWELDERVGREWKEGLGGLVIFGFSYRLQSGRLPVAWNLKAILLSGGENCVQPSSSGQCDRTGQIAMTFCQFVEVACVEQNSAKLL